MDEDLYPLNHLMRRRAFTLLEILLVVTLVASLVGFFLYNRYDSKNDMVLVESEKIVATLLQTARSTAILNNQLVESGPGRLKARLIVCASDKKDHGRHLRYLGIIYGSGDRWLPAQGGVYLPEGVYFKPRENVSKVQRMRLQYPEIGDGEGEVYLNYGRDQDAEWYYFEFDSNGNLEGGGQHIFLGGATLDEDEDGHMAHLWNHSMQTELYVNKFGQVRFFIQDAS